MQHTGIPRLNNAAAELWPVEHCPACALGTPSRFANRPHVGAAKEIEIRGYASRGPFLAYSRDGRLHKSRRTRRHQETQTPNQTCHEHSNDMLASPAAHRESQNNRCKTAPPAHPRLGFRRSHSEMALTSAATSPAQLSGADTVAVKRPMGAQSIRQRYITDGDETDVHLTPQAQRGLCRAILRSP